MGMNRTLVRASTAATIMAALLLVSGCASTDDEARPSPTRTQTSTPTPSDTATPTPTSTTPPIVEALATSVDAGAVAEGATATVSGTGPSNVTYQRQGEFAVVIGIDCTGCTGMATVTAPGRMSPLGEAAAPMSGSVLMDVFKDDPVNQIFIVQAEGPWTVTLQSWNDLATVSGPQSGTGPSVLFFSDDVPHVTVNYTPADADDSFMARAFTTSDDNQVFGNEEAFTEVFDADLPGILAIQTKGAWTVTPTP
jgi:hypothetical protein